MEIKVFRVFRGIWGGFMGKSHMKYPFSFHMRYSYEGFWSEVFKRHSGGVESTGFGRFQIYATRRITHCRSDAPKFEIPTADNVTYTEILRTFSHFFTLFIYFIITDFLRFPSSRLFGLSCVPQSIILHETQK